MLQLLAIAVALACLVAAIALLRDPRRLIRLEYARQRIACGFVPRHVHIDGRQWCYVERAGDAPDAPTLVLIHGYTGSKENWYRLCSRLGRRYRLLAPDLPGWGDSERVPGADHGFVAQAENVAAFLRQVVGAPVVLVGHSMGGAIAALVAARHPELVTRVALLNAAGAEFKENAFARAVLDGDNPFGVEDQAALERYMTILFHERRTRPFLPWPGTWAYVAARRREAAFEQSVLDRIGRGDERLQPWQEADRIHQPTLLLWGEHDHVIDPSALDLYAQRIPQARKRLLPNSGHMTLMEEPGAVADELRALIEEDA